MWRQAASHTETDDARAAIHQQTGLGDGRCELCRQVTAIAAANNVHTRACGDPSFKGQPYNDDHVIPTQKINRKSKVNPAAASASPIQLLPPSVATTAESARRLWLSP
jgi:hypothetical protein